MEVNYQKYNLVNLSNSLLKNFNVNPFHNTISEVDEILETKQYNNVVLFVCDGLGDYNLKKLLSKDSFLRTKKKLTLSSVFPPTTTAATTTLLSGLTPSEHYWFGWDMYFKDTNETISLFQNKVKEKNSFSKQRIQEKDYMNYKSILELIEEKGFKSYSVSPFSKEKPCYTLDEVIERIEELTKTNTQKFIYAYIENPDKLMHRYGIYSKVVKDEVQIINEKLEQLSKKLKNTLLLITADHGLVPNKYIVLKRDIPALFKLLERTTSIEPRACGIKLKDKKDYPKFYTLYQNYLQKDFNLMTTKEVLEKHLFGPEQSDYLKDAIGDYLLIGIANKSINYDENAPIFKANHAGIKKEEIYVPLIVIESNN